MMLDQQNITALRMERQHLVHRANVEEYDHLYRDCSPGQSIFWSGFGDPPCIPYRPSFDDIEYNRKRQKDRALVKGRFQGGNVGWIERADLELFAGLYLKPLDKPSAIQTTLLELIQREGPMNIQLMKELTGLLVKEITPVLHRLQQAFLIYEDQYDGEWDRAWYMFDEMFPDADINKYNRHQALMIVLQRFAYRQVWFDSNHAKSFYRLPEKDIKAAIMSLVKEQVLAEYDGGYLLKTDEDLLRGNCYDLQKSVLSMHRSDFLVKTNEHVLKGKYIKEGFDLLQYILVDGAIRGSLVGKFKYGPHILEDVLLDLPEDEIQDRKEEILDAIYTVYNRADSPLRLFCGKPL